MPVAVKRTAEIAVVPIFAPLHQGMSNRLPLFPVGSVRVVEIGEIDVRRQFEILAGKVLFIDIRPFGKSG